MCKTRYVFAFCACGQGQVLSRNLLAGNVFFHVFMFPEKTSLWTPSESFPMVSWLMFGSEIWNLTSNQLVSHHDPAIASSISFCCVLHKNSQRHQPTPPGAETIPSIISWFELSVGMVSAPGVVSWWRCVWRHNTMSDRHQEGWIDGGYFHLLQAPFGAAVAKKHRPHAPSWCSVAASAAQVFTSPPQV